MGVCQLDGQTVKVLVIKFPPYRRGGEGAGRSCRWEQDKSYSSPMHKTELRRIFTSALFSSILLRKAICTSHEQR